MKDKLLRLNHSTLIASGIPIGALIGLCLLLTACGSGGDKNQTTTGSNKVTITPGRVNLVEGGVPQPFSAKQVLDTGEVLKEAVFTWRSDDTSVLTIDLNSGLATAVSVGVAQVTATSGTSTGSPVTASATVGVVSPKPGATEIILSGKVSYEDKPFNQSGFIPGLPIPKPVRNAVLELVAIDDFQTIATSATNENGFYTLTANSAGPTTRRGGIFLRVVSETDSKSNTKITVQNKKSEGLLYKFASSGMDDSASSSFLNTQADILVPADSIGGVFNILDTLSQASEFVQNSGSCPPLLPPPLNDCIPPMLTAYWEQGGEDGTFFDSEIDAISILGGGGRTRDADEYDDSVIIHEYGHFIMSHFSHDDSPGGQHGLAENKQDIRLSWSEGWANFFSSAVRNVPFYVDTAPTALGGILISYNLESYSSTPNVGLNTLAKYTTSEINVGGVLWDIFDETNLSESENLDLTFSNIFQTVMSIPPAPSPATLETFWIAFQRNSLPIESANLQNIMKAREITLFADVSETPEKEQNLLIDLPQRHTLYQSGTEPKNDMDIIPFKVTTGTNYTVKTLNLRNGTDTILTIIDQDGIVIGSKNDNQSGKIFTDCSINPLSCPPNGPNNLASSVSFLWSEPNTTLQAHVSRSPIAPPSAGLFGSYDIELTPNP